MKPGDVVWVKATVEAVENEQITEIYLSLRNGLRQAIPDEQVEQWRKFYEVSQSGGNSSKARQSVPIARLGNRVLSKFQQVIERCDRVEVKSTKPKTKKHGKKLYAKQGRKIGHLLWKELI